MDNFDVLLVVPSTHASAPVAMRTAAFSRVLSKHDLRTMVADSPSSFRAFIQLAALLRKYRIRWVFITMPPFSGWLFLLLFLFPMRSIVDWRDGWSIAMKSGYGNTGAASPLKALIARVVEFVALLACHRVIVCTPGLLHYHTRGLFRPWKRRVVEITNGHQLTPVECDFISKQTLSSRQTINAICAGKFAEYGPNKAASVIDTLATRYSGSSVVFSIVGCDVNQNSWVTAYALDRHHNITIEISPKLSYSSMISAIRSSDLAVVIVRNELYELGTKAFDYVACGVPILDIFDHNLAFYNFFRHCFDTDYDPAAALMKARNFDRQVVASSVIELFGNLGRAGRG